MKNLGYVQVSLVSGVSSSPCWGDPLEPISDSSICLSHPISTHQDPQNGVVNDCRTLWVWYSLFVLAFWSWGCSPNTMSTYVNYVGYVHVQIRPTSCGWLYLPLVFHQTWSFLVQSYCLMLLSQIFIDFVLDSWFSFKFHKLRMSHSFIIHVTL